MMLRQHNWYAEKTVMALTIVFGAFFPHIPLTYSCYIPYGVGPGYEFVGLGFLATLTGGFAGKIIGREINSVIFGKANQRERPNLATLPLAREPQPPVRENEIKQTMATEEKEDALAHAGSFPITVALHQMQPIVAIALPNTEPDAAPLPQAELLPDAAPPVTFSHHPN